MRVSTGQSHDIYIEAKSLFVPLTTSTHNRTIATFMVPITFSKAWFFVNMADSEAMQSLELSQKPLAWFLNH